MSLISGFAETIKVRRFNKIEMANGKPVEPTKFRDFEIRASVQPFNPDELIAEEQGQRDKKALKLYSETKLENVDEKTKRKGDQVYYLGEWFEVQQVDAWSAPGFMPDMAHFKIVAFKVSP